ncbi:MAG: hypothetical protein QM749_04920 [Aquabacterium sp.]
MQSRDVVDDALEHLHEFIKRPREAAAGGNAAIELRTRCSSMHWKPKSKY